MSEPLLNWLSFLGFLGVVLAVIFAYWWLLDRVFDRVNARRHREADQTLEELKADMETRRKVLTAATGWKVRPR